jgi:hypothetical protein
MRLLVVRQSARSLQEPGLGANAEFGQEYASHRVTIYDHKKHVAGGYGPADVG